MTTTTTRRHTPLLLVLLGVLPVLLLSMIQLLFIGGVGRVHSFSFSSTFSSSSSLSSSLLPSSSSLLSLSLSSNHHNNNNNSNIISNTNQQDATKEPAPALRLRRELGSQENLMLPRQYNINPDVTFPSMNHICVAVLTATPRTTQLHQAVKACMQAHPLLRATIQGTGQPEKRIDLFQMVREGDTDPCTFVANSGDGTTTAFTAEDVVRMVDIVIESEGDENDDEKEEQLLTQSWQRTFGHDLDDGSSWCDVSGGTTPLWKAELHRLCRPSPSQNNNNNNNNHQKEKCALVLSFNHAISDQSSAAKLMDQLVTLLAAADAGTKEDVIPTRQSIPVSVEESVLGRGRRFKDVGTDDSTFNTVKYVVSKALEELKGSVLVPDSPHPQQQEQEQQETKTNSIVDGITTITGRVAGGTNDDDSPARTSVLTFRTLSPKSTQQLLKVCRTHAVTITNALSAAVTLTSTDFIAGTGSTETVAPTTATRRNYKVLQSLDMRRFGQCVDTGKSVGCLAGSMDLLHGPLPDYSGMASVQKTQTAHSQATATATAQLHSLFWKLAQEGNAQTTAFISPPNQYPEEAVRVFDFAMTISDLNNLVHLTAQSKTTQGRAYSAGFTNAGIYERFPSFEYDDDTSSSTSDATDTTPSATETTTQCCTTDHGHYHIEEMYYAASNARTGCLYRFSCMTINGAMQFTFHPASPLVSAETNEQFATSFMELLESIVATENEDNDTSSESDDTTTTTTTHSSIVNKEEPVKSDSTTTSSSTSVSTLSSPAPLPSVFMLSTDNNNDNNNDNDNDDDNNDNNDNGGIKLPIPDNSLVAIVTLIGLGAVGSHAAAYQNFYHSIMEMKQNIDNPDDFGAALNFWIFFAVGHPILQPILWISDVLHGSPGPMVGNLVPVTFILGNILAIGAFTYITEIRNAVNVAALFAFIAYIGAGLDGQAGLGDYNLALDDSYKQPGATTTKIVKGCPTYDEVKQPSMNNFDLEKYQGLWYEQKFHDWTQFKEVYDTTLGIKLTDNGQGWIDDFAVKGPAPDSAKLSWDKSPVANGAHYFLFGRVDPSDPKGILREKGFGVEFPNYIVDVLKDPDSGEYKEAIQFQCLERGGVRVFEGINFMSRNPTMTDQELTAMHQRAEQAGMYPYGASPEQMHTVARRPVDAPPIDNSWQAMWRAIGVDKLLELLTESIEDGGR